MQRHREMIERRNFERRNCENWNLKMKISLELDFTSMSWDNELRIANEFELLICIWRWELQHCQLFVVEFALTWRELFNFDEIIESEWKWVDLKKRVDARRKWRDNFSRIIIETWNFLIFSLKSQIHWRRQK